MSPGVRLAVRCRIDDAGLTALHARAFGVPIGPVEPWSARLARHSLTWIAAFDAEHLVGFVHAVGDGGRHAFLLDAVVDPNVQGRGIGRAVVGRLVEEVRAAGCDWLHVDHEPQLADFYRSCGFAPTTAGLLRLRT